MKIKFMKYASFMLIFALVLTGCSQESVDLGQDLTVFDTNQTSENDNTQDEDSIEPEATSDSSEAKDSTANDETEVKDSSANDEDEDDSNSTSDSSFDTEGYQLVDSNSCSLSGERVANAKVDIGYDSDYATRDYYAYTNEYGQLVYVEADEIILQNDDKEISGDDRYCSDEAKVPGVEESDLDEGHVIADSLGGASNAYNITPQGSQLNRYGTQADIEEDIRSSGGATAFTAVIEYPSTDTQIPSTYTLSYTVNGEAKSYTFENEYTPDGESEPINENTNTDEVETSSNTNTDSNISYANCTEVREAGASPIYEGDPGYSRKLDRDGDGVGCE